ncbi:5916_t:CDS:2, partial [Ambispora gerdemannii]
MVSSKERESKKLAAETTLRVILAFVMTSIIIFLAVPNIRKIVHHQDPLITINIVNMTTEGIPMPNFFVCGELIDHITVEKIPLGKRAVMVEDYLWQADETILKAGGDLTENKKDPCFIFQPDGMLKFRLTNDSESIDYISINAITQHNISSEPSQIGAVFGFWNAERDISVIKPFVARTATINHFTFTSTIRTGLNKEIHQDFTINKQNSLQIEKFELETIAVKINYSPDTYMVTKYIETQPYTWLDLVGTIGGLLTYAIAVWIFLFGRGKYRSWGFIQRFLLRNSPNAAKLPLMEKEEFNEAFSEPSLSPPPTRPDSEYYFNTTGTPTRSHFRTDTPVAVDIDMSSTGMNDTEILRKIDSRINEKLWFLEQTLSRHYLAGFRLRKYYDDMINNNQSTSPSNPNNVTYFQHEETGHVPARSLNNPDYYSQHIILSEVPQAKKRSNRDIDVIASGSNSP